MGVSHGFCAASAGRKVYEELFHKKPVFSTIHAGLECGLLSEKFRISTAFLSDRTILTFTRQKSIYPLLLPEEYGISLLHFCSRQTYDSPGQIPGGFRRRHTHRCEKRIREGRITVNDAVAKKPDLKVDPEQDQILFDHRPVIYEKYSYYLFHKPAGCVTARCDRLNRTVMDFFPESMRKSLHRSEDWIRIRKGFC